MIRKTKENIGIFLPLSQLYRGLGILRNESPGLGILRNESVLQRTLEGLEKRINTPKGPQCHTNNSETVIQKKPNETPQTQQNDRNEDPTFSSNSECQSS